MITDLIQTLNLTFGPVGRSPKWPPRSKKTPLPQAFVMSDENRLPYPLLILQKLPNNIAIVFRHYHHQNRNPLAHQLVEAAHRRGLKVLISGNLHLAKKIHADGIHLPSHMLKKRQARRIINRYPNWLITAAVHTHKELKQAEELGVDALLISPIFTTKTRVQRKSLGPMGLRRFKRTNLIPIFALGGIGLTNLHRLKNTGAIGFAGISAFRGLV